MKQTAFVVCLLVAVVYCQIGGTNGPCSAVAIPGPFSEPVSLFGSNVGASSSSVGCGGGPAAWYSLTPDAGTQVTISTCSSYTNFDTVLYVNTGSCDNLSCFDSSDDYCNSQSQVQFVSTGAEYFIAVTGFNSATGQFELTFTEVANNSSSTCQTAIAIPGPYINPVTVYGNTQPSYGYSQNICGLSSTSHIDWYLISPQPGNQVEVSTCNTVTDFDTRLSVLDGSCGSLTCLTENDDNCTTNSVASYLSFIATYNVPSYYLAVFGYGSASGTYEVRIIEHPVTSTPGGNCGNAILLPYTPGFSALYIGSTTNNPIASTFACTTVNSPSAWYRVDVPYYYTGQITASTCNAGTNYDTYLLVYSGSSCDDLRCVTQNDDYSCSFNGVSSTVFWNQQGSSTTLSVSKSARMSSTYTLSASPMPYPSVGSSPTMTVTPYPGTITYWIQVAGYGSSNGQYTLSVGFQ